MVSILNPHHLSTVIDVVLAAEQSINLLEHDSPSLGDKEVNKQRQEYVYPGEHIEGVESTVLQEGGEELLDDGVGDVLGLRGHAHGLGADVHTENLRGPDPHGSAPRWFVCYPRH